MQIQAYSFGNMKISGKNYTEDVMVFPDKIKARWWRLEGHSLCLEDLREVIAEAPLTLVVGTGAYGIMKVPENLKKELADRGIKTIDLPTDRAVMEYNRRAGKEKVAGAFHLTC